MEIPPIHHFYYGSKHGRGNYEVLLSSPGTPDMAFGYAERYLNLESLNLEPDPQPIYTFFSLNPQYHAFACTAFLGEGTRGMEYLAHILVIPTTTIRSLRGDVFQLMSHFEPKKPKPETTLISIILKPQDLNQSSQQGLRARLVETANTQVLTRLFKGQIQAPTLLAIDNQTKALEHTQALLTLLPADDRLNFSFTTRYVLGHEVPFSFATCSLGNRDRLESLHRTMVVKEFRELDQPQNGPLKCYVERVKTGTLSLFGWSLIANLEEGLSLLNAFDSLLERYQEETLDLNQIPHLPALLNLAKSNDRIPTLANPTPQETALIKGLDILRCLDHIDQLKQALSPLEAEFFHDGRDILDQQLAHMDPTETNLFQDLLKRCLPKVDAAFNQVRFQVGFHPEFPIALYASNSEKAFFNTPEIMSAVLNNLLTKLSEEKFKTLLKRWLRQDGLNGFENWQAILADFTKFVKAKADDPEFMGKLHVFWDIFRHGPYQDDPEFWYLQLIERLPQALPQVFTDARIFQLLCEEQLFLCVNKQTLKKYVPHLFKGPTTVKACKEAPTQPKYRTLIKTLRDPKQISTSGKSFIRTLIPHLRAHLSACPSTVADPQLFDVATLVFQALEQCHEDQQPWVKDPKVIKWTFTIILEVIQKIIYPFPSPSAIKLAETGAPLFARIADHLPDKFVEMADLVAFVLREYGMLPPNYQPHNPAMKPGMPEQQQAVALLDLCFKHAPLIHNKGGRP